LARIAEIYLITLVEYHQHYTYNADPFWPALIGATTEQAEPGKRWPMMTTISKPSVHKVALYQLLLLLVVFIPVALIDSLTACSILVGGLIQIGPQAWFARQAYKYTGSSQVGQVVRAMYLGETGKILLTAALFTVSFILLRQLNFLTVFSSFIVMFPSQWIFTVRILKQKR
jgi:ATP synthase protein I